MGSRGAGVAAGGSAQRSPRWDGPSVAGPAPRKLACKGTNWGKTVIGAMRMSNPTFQAAIRGLYQRTPKGSLR